MPGNLAKEAVTQSGLLKNHEQIILKDNSAHAMYSPGNSPGTDGEREKIKMNEERLIDIETKIAFQEKTIKDLNDVILEQQKEIQRLSVICEVLLKQGKELASGIDAPANEKPPHY